MLVNDKSFLKDVLKTIETQAVLLLQNKKVIEISCVEIIKNRSNDQNNYYWAFNTQVAKFLDDAGLSYGEYSLPYTKDLIHDINKKIFGKKSTARMSIKEFCEYMNRVNIFWIEKTGGEFMVDELPIGYFIKRGYDMEYMLLQR